MHTVFVVAVQAVFTPALHVDAAAQVKQGVVPAADQVDPATHAAGTSSAAVLLVAAAAVAAMF